MPCGILLLAAIGALALLIGGFFAHSLWIPSASCFLVFTGRALWVINAFLVEQIGIDRHLWPSR